MESEAQEVEAAYASLAPVLHVARGCLIVLIGLGCALGSVITLVFTALAEILK